MKDITLYCKKCKKVYLAFKIEIEGKAKIKYFCPYCGEENIVEKFGEVGGREIW